MNLTYLNLVNCENIQGTHPQPHAQWVHTSRCCLKATNTFLRRSLISNTIPSVTSGDLLALRGLQLKVLILCSSKITGTSVGAVGLEVRCCLKATTKHVPGAFLDF